MLTNYKVIKGLGKSGRTISTSTIEYECSSCKSTKHTTLDLAHKRFGLCANCYGGKTNEKPILPDCRTFLPKATTMSIEMLEKLSIISEVKPDILKSVFKNLLILSLIGDDSGYKISIPYFGEIQFCTTDNKIELTDFLPDNNFLKIALDPDSIQTYLQNRISDTLRSIINPIQH